jgi:HipA-like protein
MKQLLMKYLRFLKPDGHDEVADTQAVTGTTVRFTLSIEKLVVGYLTYDGALWTFHYADEFKQQTRIQPVTDFPRVDKVYEMYQLHPFFTHRIPSLKQERILKVIEEHHVDKTNLVQLLELFGKKTITNPFTLVMG